MNRSAYGLAAAALLVGSVPLVMAARSLDRPAHQEASKLRLAGDGAPFGAALPSVRIGEVRSFGGAMLCVTTTAVTITSVAPVDPAGGFAVQAWGVRPNPFRSGGVGLGAEPKPLAAFPAFGHTPVSGRCSDDSQSFELGVQVAKPGTATATTHGLRVDYTSNGKAGSMVVPMTIQLCAAGDHTGHCGQ